MSWTRAAAMTALLFTAVTTEAAAQACIGVPVRDGQIAIEGQLGIADGLKTYGVAATANLAGPLTVQGGYTLLDLDDVDENANGFHANLAYEVPVKSLSACPVVGVSYAKWSQSFLGVDLDVSETVIPIGFGIGKTIPAGTSLGLTLYAIPQFLHIRGKIEASDDTGSESAEENSNEFGSVFGFRLGSSAVYAGASVMFTTIEDSDPTFGVAIGLALGGRR